METTLMLTEKDNKFIAEQMNELPLLKQQFVLIICRLANMVYPTKEHKEYALGLCNLLTNIINFQKIPILEVLSDALQSVLIAYFFDQHDLINGKLDKEKYACRHQRLLIINGKVTNCIKAGYCTEEFLNELYDVV